MSVYDWQYWTSGEGSSPPLNDMKRGIDELISRRSYLVINERFPFDDPAVVAIDEQISTAQRNYRLAGGV